MLFPASLRKRICIKHKSSILVLRTGQYRVMDMIRYMQKHEYLTDDLRGIVIRAINPYKIPVTILMDDPVLRMSLTDFEKWLPDSVTIVEIH